tara:strand:- start:4797 stop:6638 length:1842 start_codon:yes stop_codon:yes gene_type:complete
MAKEAIKIEEVTPEVEELTVPTGGIGDFVMDDDELEAVYGDDSETDAKEEFGDDGIAQFPALAERMAKYGRNEDNMLAHVAEGELVIPSQFLEDEVIKQRIYDILTEAGVDDPESYVVGAESNDLNPTTGLPEFFLKKLFKGVVKGIKKVVKAVIKVVKKVAPIILPIAMPYLLPALGPMYGAALGSGIGTLIGGGSIKDALKSALVAGAVGGVTAGFGKGDGTFLQKVGDAAANPGARFSQAFSNVGEGLQSGSFQGFRDAIGKDFVDATDVVSTVESGVDAAADLSKTPVADGAQVDTTGSITDAKAATGEVVANETAAKSLSEKVAGEVAGDAAGDAAGAAAGDAAGAAAGDAAERGFLEKTGDYMFRGGQSPTDIAKATTEAGNNYVAEMAAKGITPTEAGLRLAEKTAAPGMLARFGPSAALASTAAAGAGFFEVPGVEPSPFLDYNSDGSVTTGTDLIAADPGKYLVKDLGQSVLNEETGEYEAKQMDLAIMGEDMDGYTAPTQFPLQNNPMTNQAGYLMASNPGGPFARPYVTAAEGGPIFPRRNGGIAPTEGTPGQDSVRAMLMPGEFVMTTDAVKGLGNGNVNNGIQNMYTIMRNLESRGRAQA